MNPHPRCPVCQAPVIYATSGTDYLVLDPVPVVGYQHVPEAWGIEPREPWVPGVIHPEHKCPVIAEE